MDTKRRKSYATGAAGAEDAGARTKSRLWQESEEPNRHSRPSVNATQRG